MRTSYTSLHGRAIPITVFSPLAPQSNDFVPFGSAAYHQDLRDTLERIRTDLALLEAQFGPSPHEALLAANQSGMLEYAGAVLTATRHELVCQRVRPERDARRSARLLDRRGDHPVRGRDPAAGRSSRRADVRDTAGTPGRDEGLRRALPRHRSRARRGYRARRRRVRRGMDALRARELIGGDAVLAALRGLHDRFRRSCYRTRDFAALLEWVYPADAPLPFATWFGPMPSGD